MATHQSDYAKGVKFMPAPMGSEVVSVRMPVTIPTTQLANDMIHFGELPEDCVPIDFMLDYDDLDAGTAFVIDVGIVDGAGTAISTAAADGGDEWIDGGTQGQAAGFARATTAACVRTQPAATRRMVGAKIMVVAGTPQAGVLAMTLLYRAKHLGS